VARVAVQSLPGTLSAPHCANSLVADPAKILCSTDTVVESALGDAEAARRGLARDNERLRALLTQAANDVRDVVYACQAKAVDEGGAKMDVEQVSLHFLPVLLSFAFHFYLNLLDMS
jgi:hypothetical protein